MICLDCNRGSILPGTPTGSIVKVQGLEAYFAPAPPQESEPRSVAVVVLPDMFGFPLVNTKLIADELARNLACDVWVPDIFNGEPILKVDGMEFQLLIPGRSDRTTWWDSFRIYLLIIPRIGIIIRNRSSVVDLRVKSFIKAIREDKKYSKVGGVGYSFGGGVAVRLAANPDVLESAVICYPGLFSVTPVKNIKSPTSWVCAKEDSKFTQKMRLKAEAIFVERKNKGDPVLYEFVDYEGADHGFANRPNLALEEAKVAFEKGMEQTKAWLRKTLDI